ncbi:MAG: DUF6089 family protein [Vicingaceae bacterium]|nr:DUF6089 family protein [Vicingaceae bacterium]
MRKLLIAFIFTLITSVSGYSQYYVDYGISAGASNYLGEFGGGEGKGRGFVADMEFSFTRWTLGGFYRYRLSPKVALKGSLNYIRLSGDDDKSDNPGRKTRNLNFKNDMFEVLVNAEYYIFKVNDVGGTGRYRADFNLYLYGGLGAFYSNPKGQTVAGDWVSLRGLNSEGKSYSAINMAIPLGIGFYYTLDRKYRIGMEIGWRTTFTDYIDDASTVYANDYDGITNKTDQALVDAINAEYYPGEQGNRLSNFIAGSKRGNPDNNDSYMTMTVNFSWAIRGRSKFYKAKYSWIHGNKRRSRRSRPKF